jgi:nitroreductase
VEFGEVIRKRRMVRAFTIVPFDPEVAQRLLTAANRAPSAGFSQGYALLVLDRADQPPVLGPARRRRAACRRAGFRSGVGRAGPLRALVSGIRTPGC